MHTSIYTHFTGYSLQTIMTEFSLLMVFFHHSHKELGQRLDRVVLISSALFMVTLHNWANKGKYAWKLTYRTCVIPLFPYTSTSYLFHTFSLFTKSSIWFHLTWFPTISQEDFASGEIKFSWLNSLYYFKISATKLLQSCLSIIYKYNQV